MSNYYSIQVFNTANEVQGGLLSSLTILADSVFETEDQAVLKEFLSWLEQAAMYKDTRNTLINLAYTEEFYSEFQVQAEKIKEVLSKYDRYIAATVVDKPSKLVAETATQIVYLY